jgi:uncharacterized phage protein (TIGR02218 family)
MSVAELEAHLGTGHTTVSRCWKITRNDGEVLGFTDHDRDLSFDGVDFKAETGLTAMALQQGTGLAVDNTEALGALSSTAIREEDIEAGRYDGAEVLAYLVNWADVSQRKVLFRGFIGEVRRTDGQFQAELRGLTDLLNRPIGRAYQKPCTAVFGDRSCGVDLDAPGMVATVVVQDVPERLKVRFSALHGYDAGWFERGAFQVVDGAAHGLSVAIKRDVTLADGSREIELWQSLRAELAAGDTVRLVVGCDKRFDTCVGKFANGVNFQGFPDIPGEDWMISQPSKNAQRESKRKGLNWIRL